MSYKFDKTIIHDNESMWHIACSFINHYKFILEQVERSNEYESCNSILYKGEIRMEWHKDYKKILSDYKKELKFMDNFLSFDLEQENSKLQKYITEYEKGGLDGE